MGMSYTKLFSTIIHSTIWRSPDHVRIVWVTMLAMADKDGEVHASVPGLADAARVSVAKCRKALESLQLPDEDSNSKEHDGRRILPIDGGWWLINHKKYRDMLSDLDKRERNRIRVARHRARKAECNADVTDVTPPVTCNAGNDTQKQIAEAECEPAHTRVASLGPEGDAFIAELSRHDIFRGSDVTGLAEQILGHMMANGKPLAWHLDAIRRTATKATGAKLSGDPWPPARLGEYLLTATRSPSRPREVDEAPAAGRDDGMTRERYEELSNLKPGERVT